MPRTNPRIGPRIKIRKERHLWPLLLALGLSGSLKDVLAAPAEGRLMPSGDHLCRSWTVVHVAGHPEWPGRFLATGAACEGSRKDGQPAATTVRAGRITRLRFVLANAAAEIQTTALEAGREGDVVRFRSSLNDAILWGCLRADGGADLVLHRSAARPEGVW